MADEKKDASGIDDALVDQGMDFGISSNVRDLNKVPFPVEQKYRDYEQKLVSDPHHPAILKEVTVRKFVAKNPVTLPGVVLEKDQKPTVEQVEAKYVRHMLDFVFTSPSGDYEHVHTIWEIEADDKDRVRKKEWNDDMLAKLWAGIFHYGTGTDDPLAATVVFDNPNLVKHNNGKPLKGYGDYFNAVANIFNTSNDGKPVYQDGNGQPIKLRIKLEMFNGRPTMPMFQNVVETISANTGSRLTISSADKYTMGEKKGARKTAAKADSNSNPDWPEDL